MELMEYLQNLIKEYARYKSTSCFALSVEFNIAGYNEIKKRQWLTKFEYEIDRIKKLLSY